MTTLATESFTGSNGAAWPSQWVEGQTQSGSSAEIQGNTGVLISGNVGGYSGSDRIGRRLNITAPVDVDISGTWTPDSNEPYGVVVVRGDNALDSEFGYQLELNKSGTIKVTKWASYSSTDVGSFSFSASSGVTYGFRFRVVGTSIRARVWSGTEPGTWGIDTTDSSVTAAGAVGLVGLGGNAAIHHSIAWDDIVVTDGSTAVTWNGSATLTTASAMTSSAFLAKFGNVALATVSSIFADLGQPVAGSAALTTASAMTADGVRLFEGSATLTTGSAMAATATPASIDGAATLSSHSELLAFYIAPEEVASTGSNGTYGSGLYGSGAYGGIAFSIDEFGNVTGDRLEFTPPVVYEYFESRHPLFRRMRKPVGVTILRTGNSIRQVREPESAELEAADLVFLGGHIYRVDGYTASLLAEAGYGQYLAFIGPFPALNLYPSLALLPGGS